MPPETLCLQTGPAGAVWYEDGEGARDSRQAPAIFVAGPRFVAAPLVRLAGNGANAGLVTGILAARLAGRLPAEQKVVLCSPLGCGGDDPLGRLWLSARTADPSCPSFELCAADAAPYGLTAAVRAEDTASALGWLPRHPAWAAMSFVPAADPCAWARLATCIVDVRWFRHPRHPGRLSRLYAFLGLADLRGITRPRCRQVLDCWAEAAPGQRDRPECFLDRIALAARDPTLGRLLAARACVRLVYEVWSATRSGDPRRFDPALFFHRPDEVVAFERHRDRSF